MQIFMVVIFSISSLLCLTFTARKREIKLSKEVVLPLETFTVSWGICLVQSTDSVYEILKPAICYQILLTAALIDWRERKIPNCISVSLLGCGCLCLLLELFFTTDTYGCFLAFVEAFLVFSIFFLCYGVLKHQIGAGDLKLLAGIGLLCGIRVLFLLLMISFCLGLLLLIFNFFCKKCLRIRIPLAPVLYIAFFIVYFFKI